MKIWNGCNINNNNNDNGHDNFMNENANTLKLNINSSQNKTHYNRFQLQSFALNGNLDFTRKEIVSSVIMFDFCAKIVLSAIRSIKH